MDNERFEGFIWGSLCIVLVSVVAVAYIAMWQAFN